MQCMFLINPSTRNNKLTPMSGALSKYAGLDVLATSVAVVRQDGAVLHVNAAFEDLLGVSHKVLLGSDVASYFQVPQTIAEALRNANGDDCAAMRFEAHVLLGNSGAAGLATPVHVVVSPAGASGEAVLELLPLEQQLRLEREERLVDQALANKELIRGLAHEIKNPLGGIRGAAQLLQLDLERKDLREYTQVIIHEADRLQVLVDRLLAPHRSAHVVSDVNIHEVCERVRAVVLAEYPQGLSVVRDYDTSLPELRGDREQLIQAVLNIAQNAAQALAQRRAAGDARITFRTRVARQVTLAKVRYKLALELHVIDNGPGVSPEIKDRLFYPLVSGRDGGTGLGLTLAQTFVQQHNGLIECDSTGQGTDFKMSIPLL
jgi:two-component system, NtrC family, nitrogen regulation sensor histidine kinase GlnL